ncbi:hypothetical protein Ae406Ps2_5381 [Pseudonocardia sp. Ae406_Ps2]|nr:hypothetical protein Ae331Ps2_0652c [Pseudonocardia sp. Ae331_Ps2]OLM00577.1 hypothetical protein Ae406Ps2_0577c [Pseudonocardia sp. Ae406_Ps2]OLL97739.1 hypothetical protein Ae331Ps2_1406c [Pseudonocardia sp. Ae331_Ps2]OLL98821.1 hypothetical protein Ae331Ps2_2488 [Pseudonocardia sp. Ae331_Ps2]OLL98825.1 hypothetical protein Ae331Ps2_2492 [Pseudonocardia sp. Ae331_Ps2]
MLIALSPAKHRTRVASQNQRITSTAWANGVNARRRVPRRRR